MNRMFALGGATISLLVSALAGHAPAQEPSTDPSAARLIHTWTPEDDPGPPGYARHFALAEEGWVAMIFYRDPTCVPTGRNLLEFVDPPAESGPAAFGCGILVRGVTFWEQGPGVDFAPKLMIFRDEPGMQIWFAPLTEFNEAAAGGTLTMAELESLDPLVGTVEAYREVHHLDQPAPQRVESAEFMAMAYGTLADGRSFDLELHVRASGVMPDVAEEHLIARITIE